MRALVLATTVSCLLSGCYARETVGPPAVEVTAGVPDAIETYPSTTYEGRPVYLYRDHWYYRDGGGRWAYYRDEPAPLHEHRMRVQPPRRVEPPHEERRERNDR
jgi:hypothetical protein